MIAVKARGRSNYEYVTARVRSRRAKLFSEDDYRKLIRMGTGEIARFMEESEYETEMNALGARYSGVDLIEYALNRNLAKHFHDLLRWSNGALYDYIVRYLRKFDAWNAKTVLRGKYSDAEQAEIQDDLILAGEFDEDLLDSLVAAGSVVDVIAGLEGTIFYDPLVEAQSDYEEDGVLVPLENAIDRSFYESLITGLSDTSNRATKLYKEFLEAEIDFRNVRNVLRLVQSGADIDPEDYFIDGGYLFDRSAVRRVASNRDELIADLLDSRYGNELEDAIQSLDSAESLIRFEHALDGALLNYSQTLSNRYPLSICPVLAYILAKERETENIRAVARGKEAGLSTEEIEQELVFI